METDDKPIITNPQVHDLKCSTLYFWMVEAGLKPFELRLNDRDYRGGDYLLLREYDDETERYTGKTTMVRVLCIVGGGPWLQDNYVAMGIQVLV